MSDELSKCPICGAKCWFSKPLYHRYECECVIALTISGKQRITYSCVNTLQVIDSMKDELKGLKAYIAETEERGRQAIAQVREEMR